MVQESQLEAPTMPDPTATSAEDEAKIAGKSPTRLAIERFRDDRLSMVAFVVTAVYVLAGVLAPFLDKFGVLNAEDFHQNLINVSNGGLPKGKYGGISWHHWLGVEPGTGRDVLSRIWLGITYSLAIAITATIVAVVLGAVLGIIAGFTGGWVDAVIGRIIDLTLSFPQTLMLLALSGLFVQEIASALHLGVGSDLVNGIYITFVLGAFGWPSIARIIRGQVLSIREREFVDAAKSFGASNYRIYFKEILPNLWAPLLVSFTLYMPAYISAEAALSYLGVGIKPPTPTLGNILDGSIDYSQADFVFFFAPAFFIMIIVVSFNLLGDGIRDALDPKAQR